VEAHRDLGWVLDPDRKKMSKSKGNVVTPLALLEEHGSDGVRYWAASGRRDRHRVRHESDARRPTPGDQESECVEVRAWRRRAARRDHAPVDRAMLRSLAALVTEATEAFDSYDYARRLQRTESFFWRFCDDYLELVKGRRYGEQGSEGAASANAR
jgi:valyl-tRNA synthetase